MLGACTSINLSILRWVLTDTHKFTTDSFAAAATDIDLLRSLLRRHGQVVHVVSGAVHINLTAVARFGFRAQDGGLTLIARVCDSVVALLVSTTIMH